MNVVHESVVGDEVPVEPRRVANVLRIISVLTLRRVD
jgi:hypothetical protein